MLDEKKVQQAVKKFCRKPYWREQYESAPTPLSKRYVALQFYWSTFLDATDYIEEKQRLEDTMGLEDWEFLLGITGNNPFRSVCVRKIEEFKARQQDEEMKNSHIVTMEELFTMGEMDEARMRILSDEQCRQKYEKAPSDTLRQYYLLEECFVVHGDKNGVEDVLDGTATMIWQLQDAFTPEDWEYENCNAADSAYKQRCIWKVSGKPHNRQGGRVILI
ncbi:MAG: hypothetical protein LUD51_01345 [Clostridia bacterium]|nr:hypothetical protein [Clostridia bacterium]